MKIKMFQQGGPAPVAAPAEGAAPAPEMGAPVQGGAEEQMAQLAQQLVEMLMQQIGDPQAVAAILQMALEMVQGAAQEAPVFKCGGKMVKKNKKAACGMKIKK